MLPKSSTASSQPCLPAQLLAEPTPRFHLQISPEQKDDQIPPSLSLGDDVQGSGSAGANAEAACKPSVSCLQ